MGSYTREKLTKAFDDIESADGTDKFTAYVYDRLKFDMYIYSNQESGDSWRTMKKHIDSCLSPAVKGQLKSLVLSKKEDPFWLEEILSQGEMKKLILEKSFGEEKTMYFMSRAGNKQLIEEVAQSLPDSLIIKYDIGGFVEKIRYQKISDSLNLADAYSFVGNSTRYNDKVLKKLLQSRVSEVKDGYDALFYFGNGFITKKQVNAALKRMTTDELVKDFPSRSSFYPWTNYEFNDFGKIVMNSMKTNVDKESAKKFLLEKCDQSEEIYWEKKFAKL